MDSNGFSDDDLAGSPTCTRCSSGSTDTSRFSPPQGMGIPRPRRPPALTPRERVVLELLATGSTAEGVAARLAISPRTVHKHQEHLYRKLGACDRLSAVLAAQTPRAAACSRRGAGAQSPCPRARIPIGATPRRLPSRGAGGHAVDDGHREEAEVLVRQVVERLRLLALLVVRAAAHGGPRLDERLLGHAVRGHPGLHGVVGDVPALLGVLRSDDRTSCPRSLRGTQAVLPLRCCS